MADGRVPFVTPPPGSQAFGTDNSTLHRTYGILAAACVVVTTACIIARTYARVYIQKRWLFEDWAATLCYIGFLGWLTTTGMMHIYKGGSHAWDVERSDVLKIMKWYLIVTVVYSAEVLICKLTLLHIYRMLFVTNLKSRLNKILRIAEITVIGFYVSQFFTKLFECSPVARAWDNMIRGSCLNKSAILNASGLFNLLSDIFILLLPVFSVMKLRIRRSKKAQIIFALTLGAAAPAVSLIGYVVRIQLGSLPDLTYNLPLIILFAIVEVALGVVCICLPHMPALISHRRSQHNTSNTSYTGHAHRPSSPIILNTSNNNNNRRTIHSRASIGRRDGETSGRAEYIALNSPTEPSTPQESYFNSSRNIETPLVPLAIVTPSFRSSHGPPPVAVHPPDSNFPTDNRYPNNDITLPDRTYAPPTRHSATFQLPSDGGLRRVKPDLKEEKEKFIKHQSSFS